MKVLNNVEINVVSGGSDLVITQQIATDGVSDVCVASLVQALQNKTLTDEQRAAAILSGCHYAELDILADRLDTTIPCKVDFI